MESVLVARNNFKIVEAIIDWIDTVEFKGDGIIQLFNTKDIIKDDHKKVVDDLNLGQRYVGKRAQVGSEFLDFRENLWLHSASI
ncbi:hypothetical protein PR002_g11390 [Phytophthora rubi]|uniref:Uncharacterized protein n=1 Tax=Phytophthora rubi TaxID=129364 RepID=A0A6A3M4I2_9STRA|nr:hypothetical protein PR002_g11390 [Phytophthora rubi]